MKWFRRKPVALIAVVCAGAVFAVGCGSDSNSGSSDSSSASSELPPGVKEAQSLIEKHLQAPKELPVNRPLKARPPTDKKIIWVQCALPVCKVVGDGVESGAKALGWGFQRINEGSTPDEITAAWDRVVQLKPDAVAQGGLPRVLFQGQLDKLKAAGIPYVGGSVLDEVGDGMIANVAAREDFQERGLWMARWVVADTKGKANTIFFNIKDFPVLVEEQAAFEKEYARLCPNCELTKVNVATTAIGSTLPDTVVSKVRSTPDANYLVFGIGDMTIGVPEALRAANLDKRVKGVSQAGGPQNFTHIMDDFVEVATVPEPDQLSGWSYVDAIARSFTGDEIRPKEYTVLPRQLLTKENIQNPDAPYAGIPGYDEKFKSLWQIP
jgi:ribose transport system substrate-binding protein